MNLSFEWFKEYGLKNDRFGTSIYSTIVKLFDELYDEEKILFFYPKKYRNPDEMELFFFFEDGYLVVTKEGSEYHLDRHFCKVVSNTIKTNKFLDKLKLVIKFDNGDVLSFNNEEDSYYDEEEYLKILKELNSMIEKYMPNKSV